MLFYMTNKYKAIIGFLPQIHNASTTCLDYMGDPVIVGGPRFTVLTGMDTSTL